VGNMYEDGGYAGLHPRWHAEDSAWKATNIRRIRENNKIHFDSAAEVGCGAGIILKELARYPHRLTLKGRNLKYIP
jgi:hypothetical protein